MLQQQRSYWLFISVVLSLICLLIRADENSESLTGQANALKQEIAGWNLLGALALTPIQKDAIGQIVQEADEIVRAYHAHEVRWAKDFEVALVAFRKEAMADKGFSPEVERKAAGLSHQDKKGHKEFCEKINHLEDKVEQLLNPQQRLLVQEYQPNQNPRHKLKSAPKQQGKPKIGEAREELAKIRKETEGSLGKIARFLLAPCMLPYYKNYKTSPGSSPAVMGDQQTFSMERQQQPKIEALRQEITLLNLINGLYLTETQLRQILALAQEAKNRLQQKQENEAATANLLRQEIAILLKMREAARSGNGIPEYLGKELHKLRKPLGNRELIARHRDQLQELSTSLDNILQPSQKQVIADFKPCLVPPKNLKDPVRAGQVENNDHLGKLLKKWRNMPVSSVNNGRLQTAMNEALQRIEEHQGRYTEDERREVVEKWQNVLNEARQMSDEEFEISQEELAQKLKPFDKKERLHELLGQEDQKHQPGKAVRFLLAPKTIPILEERLKQVLDNKKDQAADLSKLPKKAESCRDGKCAVDD